MGRDSAPRVEVMPLRGGASPLPFKPIQPAASMSSAHALALELAPRAGARPALC